MTQKKIMVFTEIAASTLAIISILILVYAFLPYINPPMFNILNKKEEFGMLRYISGICGAGTVFWFSNRLNKKAILMRKENSENDKNE
jgi:hypothetical protein